MVLVPAVTRFMIASKALPPLLHDFGMLNTLVGLSTVVQRTPLANKFDTATISFLVASSVGQFCSSIHPILDNAAWSIFLQSALVLGLWAGENMNDTVNAATKATSNQWTNYLPMVVAFAFGTLGSLLGGFVSFHVVATLFPSYNLSHFSLVAASLTASYVGGTVNYFETASLLGGFRTIAKSKLLKLVAGVDIAIMVLYFWILNTVRNSPILRNILFPAHDEASTTTPSNNLLIESVSSATMTQSVPINKFHRPKQFITNPMSKIHTLLPLSAAVVITTVAQGIQTYCSVPGLSVMFSVLSAVFVMQLWKKMVSYSPQKERIITMTSTAPAITVTTASTDEAVTAETAETATATALSKAMKSFCSHSRGASMYMLSMFYATIGIGARMNELPSVGRPLLTIIGTLLGVHFTTLLILSNLWNMGVRRWTSSSLSTIAHPFAFLIDVDTAVIASNACVGGAATAAQMAASFLVSSTDNATNSLNKREGNKSLAVAASFVGIVGYLIGTPLGVMLAKTMHR